MLEGNQIYLIKTRRSSLEQLRQWRNQHDLRKYFREFRELGIEDQERWFLKIENDFNQFNFEIIDKKNDKLIGHCGLHYISWTNRTAEFGIYVGDKTYRGRGYGSDALRTLIKYGFEELNMNRIWCEVYSNNDALQIYKHLDFVEEGVLRQNYYSEGKYWDSHILSMLKEEYLSK